MSIGTAVIFLLLGIALRDQRRGLWALIIIACIVTLAGAAMPPELTVKTTAQPPAVWQGNIYP